MAEKYMSTSPYAYVLNNPINHRDFMGLWSFPVYVNGVLDHYVYGDGGWDTANSTLGGGGGSDLPSCYGGNGGGDGGFGSSGGGGGSSSSGGSLKVNKNISFSDFRYQRGFGGFFMQLKAWWSMKFSWEKEIVRVWGSEESSDVPKHFTEDNIIKQVGDIYEIFRMTTLDRFAGNVVETVIQLLPGGIGYTLGKQSKNPTPSTARDVALEIMDHAGDAGFTFGKYLSKGFTLYQIGDILYNSSKTAVEFLEEMTFKTMKNYFGNDILRPRPGFMLFDAPDLNQSEVLNIMNVIYYEIQTQLSINRFNITTNAGINLATKYVKEYFWH